MRRIVAVGTVAVIAGVVGCEAPAVVDARPASDAALGGDVPVCPIACIGAGVASLELACGPSDLASVTLSGSCAEGDSSQGSYATSGDDVWIGNADETPGVCHVELTFATGFTYSTDITFATMPDTQPPGCSPCPDYVGPTQSSFMVDNPCADAGVADAVAD
jgi:hypothetical protein